MGPLRYLLVVVVAFAVAAWWAGLLWRAPDTARRTRLRRRSETVGGWGLLAGVVGGVAAGGDVDDLSLGLLVVGLALGAVGILGDRRRLSPAVRVPAEALAGVAGVVVGAETGITATVVTNAALVVVVVVVLIEAMRSLETAPGGATAVGAPAFAALGAAGAWANQPELAVVALAVAGGLAGVLVARGRLRLWLGDSGCMLAGFLLATLLVALRPRSPGPANAAVLLPAAAVPLLNLVVVATGRLRRRRRLGSRRRDGLAHRLRARPMPWWAALSVLGAAQAAIGLAVALAARGSVPAPLAPIAAGAAAVVLLMTATGRVHSRAVTGLSLRARLVVVATGAGALLLVAPAALALLEARTTLGGAADAAERGLAAARSGRVAEARLAFDQAGAAFAEAEGPLGSPLASLALAVPVLGPNLEAARGLAEAGAHLADVAVDAAAETDGLRLRNAALDLAAVGELEAPLRRGLDSLRRADDRLSRADSPWLVPVVADKLGALDERVDQALPEAENALAVTQVAPAMLGGEGPRRYFVALQNPAELRGSGGILGNFGELTAVDGQLELVRTGRATDLNLGGSPESRRVAADDLPAYLARYGRRGELIWQDMTLSPHFPAVAGAIEEYYPRYGGTTVDGVISLDPAALAALLELTGPVQVPEWPEPIGAANATDILLREQYLRFETVNTQRIDFLDSLLRATFERLRAGELPGPGRVAEVLAPMVDQERLKLHSIRPEEQSVIEELGAAGGLAPFADDAVELVTNNSGGNKLDIFLERSLSYTVRPEPSTGEVTATAEIRLESSAPAGGLPPYVIGSGGPVKSPPGTNRMYLSLYTPLEVVRTTVDGEPVGTDIAFEEGRLAHSAFLSVPPGGTTVVVMELAGRLPADGRYRLDLGHQPAVRPDRVEIALAPPDGAALKDLAGLTRSGGGATATVGRLEEDRTFAADLSL